MFVSSHACSSPYDHRPWHPYKDGTGLGEGQLVYSCVRFPILGVYVEAVFPLRFATSLEKILF